MSHYLGYLPEGPDLSYTYFDMLGGEFTQIRPNNVHYIADKPAANLHRILGMNFDELMDLKWSNEDRREALQHLVTYHQLHTAGLLTMQSHIILQTIFE